MRPFHHPRPNAGQPHRPRPGDPGPPPHPMHPHQLNPAAFPNLAAANPMVAAAAANPFLAMQLFGQAQQLQSLGFLAAAALQQPQAQAQFFPGGFPPPNPNQFGVFPGQHAGFSGCGGFRPGGIGAPGGPRPPRPMMGAPGNGYNSGGGRGIGAGAPRPMLNGGVNDQNSGGGSGGGVNHTKNKPDGISHFASENGERKNTTDPKARFNPRRDGRDDRQFGPSGGRGKGRFSNQGRGRGRNNWREGKSNFRSSDSPASGQYRSDSPAPGQCRSDSPASAGQRKRPPIIYDANEVKQWLASRKKNYPTGVNISKKSSQKQPDGEKKDEEAKVRRQELKQVLAKQKELGFELPELPPGYLSENEDQGNERKSNWKPQNGDRRFANRMNNKRPRHDRRDLQSKRPKVWNQTHQDDGAMVKSKEPTLLQKLLSSDVKRDRHRLLHTFKFMILNNFFSDSPDKPLEFPTVKVNQIEFESDTIAEDLDDLIDTETTMDVTVDCDENGDKKVSSSSDGETSCGNNDEGDDDDDDDDNTIIEDIAKDGNEEDDAEEDLPA